MLGDRWSMVILRDVMFGDRRTFTDILNNSLEGVATNILASRLKKLVVDDMLTGKPDPNHKQRTIYSLTEKSIALLPALIALGAWGRRFLPATPELTIRNQLLEEGGPELQEAFMAELRERHLGVPNPREGPSVSAQMQAAYETAVARTQKDI